MSGDKTDAPSGRLVLDYDFDEPPEKLWRALSIPGFRESWLPDTALADPEPSIVTPGQAVRYRMRESDPPYLESVVTFEIAANSAGGTSLRVIHELALQSGSRSLQPANSNSPALMRAA